MKQLVEYELEDGSTILIEVDLPEAGIERASRDDQIVKAKEGFVDALKYVKPIPHHPDRQENRRRGKSAPRNPQLVRNEVTQLLPVGHLAIAEQLYHRSRLLAWVANRQPLQ